MSDTETFNNPKKLVENLSDFSLDEIEEEVAFNAINKTHVAHQEFLKFLNNPILVTNPGDKQTNIYIPEGATYNIPQSLHGQFFAHLEACRRQNIRLHFVEKQLEYSGIMLDFDINHGNSENQVGEENIQCMVQSAFEVITSSLTQKTSMTAAYVGVLKSERPQFRANENTSYYRESIHILFPGIQCTKHVKKYIIKEMINMGIFEHPLDHVELTSSNILDVGCAFVPVHFVGCCKKKNNKVPDPLYGIYKVNKSRNRITLFNCTKDFADANICWEFSLNYEAYHPIIKKEKYEPTQEVEHNIHQINDNIDTSEVSNVRAELDALKAQDPESSVIHKLLGILNIERAIDYRLWRQVLYVLASQPKDYKPLAKWFSQRAPDKYNPTSFNIYWTECVNRSKYEPYSIGAIHSWARQDNEQKYNVIMGNTVYNILLNDIFHQNGGGKLGHMQFARILQIMVNKKYVVTKVPGEKKSTWFEFIMPGDKQRSGQVYKYSASEGPESFDIYISTCLHALLTQAAMFIDKKAKNAESKELQNYFKIIKKSVSDLMYKVNDFKWKENLIKQCATLFIDYRFGEQVDKVENVLGVGNGVILLDKCPKLIDYHHTYPITKFTTTEYKPYDPHNAITIRLEKIIRDLFCDDEQDSYEFIMCWLASSLDYRAKKELFLLIKGGGSNGKTMLLEMYRYAMGIEFCCEQDGKMLTEQSRDPESAKSAAMRYQYSRANFYDEFGPNAVLLDVNLKRYVGGTIPARLLNQNTQTITIKGIHIGLTNHDIHVPSTDYGTWRRFMFLELKMSFLYPNDPKKPYDPTNKYHRLCDDTIKGEFISRQETRESFLSILVKWYSIFMVKYAGSISNVPCPTIKMETEKYRIKQDNMARWISTRVVKCEDNRVTSIDDFVNCYRKWYEDTISDKYNKTIASDVLNRLKESKLGELKAIIEENGSCMVHGYRPLRSGCVPEGNEQVLGQTDPDHLHVILNRFESVDHRMTMDEWYSHVENNLHLKQKVIQSHVTNKEVYSKPITMKEIEQTILKGSQSYVDCGECDSDVSYEPGCSSSVFSKELFDGMLK